MATILALDLGKFKSVSCFFDVDVSERLWVFGAALHMDAEIADKTFDAR